MSGRGSTPSDDFDSDPDAMDRLLADLDDGIASEKSKPKAQKEHQDFGMSPIKSSIKTPDKVSPPAQGKDKKVTFEDLSANAHPDDKSLSPAPPLASNPPTSSPAVRTRRDISKFVDDLFSDDLKLTDSSQKKSPSGIFAQPTFNKRDAPKEDDKPVNPAKSTTNFMETLLGTDDDTKKLSDVKTRSDFISGTMYKSSTAAGKKSSESVVRGYTARSEKPIPGSRSTSFLDDFDNEFGSAFAVDKGRKAKSNESRPASATPESFRSNDLPPTAASRRRPATGRRSEKNFILDDDDILGDFRKKSSPTIVQKQNSFTGQQQGEDWLSSTLSRSPVKDSSKNDEHNKFTAKSDGKFIANLGLSNFGILSASSINAQFQSLSQAGLEASSELQTQLQDQLLHQQQEAVQMLQQQQKQLETQFAEQSKQQIDQQRNMLELLSRQQKAAIDRYQVALSYITNLSAAVPRSDSNCPVCGDDVSPASDQTYRMQVQQLEESLKLLRSHHESQLKLMTEMQENKDEQSSIRFETMRSALFTSIDTLQECLKDQQKVVQQQHSSEAEVRKSLLSRLEENYKQMLEAQEQLHQHELEAVKNSIVRTGQADEVLQKLSANTNNLSELSQAVHDHCERAQTTLGRTIQEQQEQVTRLESQLLKCQLAAEAREEQLLQLVKQLENRLGQEAADLQEKTWRNEELARKLEEEKSRIYLQRQKLEAEKLETFKRLAEIERRAQQHETQLRDHFQRLLREQGATDQRHLAADAREPRSVLRVLLQEVTQEKEFVERTKSLLCNERLQLEFERKQIDNEKIELTHRAAVLLRQERKLQEDRERHLQEERKSKNNMKCSVCNGPAFERINSNSIQAETSATGEWRSRNNDFLAPGRDLRPAAVMARLAAMREVDALHTS